MKSMEIRLPPLQCFAIITFHYYLFCFFFFNVSPTPNGGMTSIGKRNGGGNGLLAKRVGVRVYTARGNKRYARRKCGDWPGRCAMSSALRHNNNN